MNKLNRLDQFVLGFGYVALAATAGIAIAQVLAWVTL